MEYKHGGEIYKHAKHLNIPPSEIIDSSASLVPFPTPRFLNNSLASLIKEEGFRFYPDTNLTDLKEVIGSFHNINPNNILPGNGASELITWIGFIASKIGKSSLPIPGFVDYERSLNCWDADYQFDELPKEWDTKFPQVFPISPPCEILWLTNPHNPTGQLWGRESIEKMIKNYKLVICDEAFLPITPKGEQESLIPLIKDNKNLLVIRSMTKLFSIAGLRLGYIVGSKDILKKIELKRDPWPLNCFAIKAGITILKDKNSYNDWISRIHNWVSIEYNWMVKKLSNINSLVVHNSATNFFLIEGKNSLKGNIDFLAQQGILIRNCQSFRSLNEKWARISLQTRKKNQILINEIQRSFNFE